MIEVLEAPQPMSEHKDHTIKPAEDIISDIPSLKPNLPDLYEPSAARALKALAVELRFNLRSQRAELFQWSEHTIPHAPVLKWLTLTDRAEGRLRDLLARRFTHQTSRGPQPMRYAKERWTMTLDAHLCSREIDPFVEWLNHRPDWDEHERLDTYLDDLFDAGTSPLVKWVGQFLFLGAVHRAYTPGAKLDEMPVLVGAQGIGKSSFLLNMFPPEHSVWFNDGLHLASDPKIRAEAIQGRVLVEVSEMAGSTKADLESLKAFVSRQDDGSVRLAFRRNPEPTPRRCIIVGSTNRLDALPNDPTGNRRFVPITLNPATQAVEDYLDEHRDQLWSEALTRHAAGVNPKLPRDLMPQAAVAAETHRSQDVMIEDALDILPPDFKGTLAEIAQKISITEMGVRLSMRDQKRLSAALTVRGYVRKQVKKDGVNRRIWKKKR